MPVAVHYKLPLCHPSSLFPLPSLGVKTCCLAVPSLPVPACYYTAYHEPAEVILSQCRGRTHLPSPFACGRPCVCAWTVPSQGEFWYHLLLPSLPAITAVLQNPLLSPRPTCHHLPPTTSPSHHPHPSVRSVTGSVCRGRDLPLRWTCLPAACLSHHHRHCCCCLPAVYCTPQHSACLPRICSLPHHYYHYHHATLHHCLGLLECTLLCRETFPTDIFCLPFCNLLTHTYILPLCIWKRAYTLYVLLLRACACLPVQTCVYTGSTIPHRLVIIPALPHTTPCTMCMYAGLVG